MNDGIEYKPSKKFIFNFKIPKEYFVISVIVLKFMFSVFSSSFCCLQATLNIVFWLWVFMLYII